MASFHYTAIDSGGTQQAGELESTSRAAALAQLSRRGLIPLDLRSADPGFASVQRSARQLALPVIWWPGRRSGMPRKELATFVQSLAALLEAGLTVDRALSIAAQTAPTQTARTLALSLERSVRSGQTLADSFGRLAAGLPPYFESMVRAGEASGSLAETMTRLAELIRRQVETAESVKSALTYPALLSSVVLVTLVLLLSFVLPRFELLFEDAGNAIPTSTRTVLWVGRFVADWWPTILSAVVAIAALAITWLHSPAGKMRFHRWLVSSRFTGGLPGLLETARFVRTFGTLLAAGSTVPEAITIARATLRNLALRSGIDQALKDVRAGKSFSASLTRTAVFPAAAVQLLLVGEETGRLDRLAISVADFLEQDARQSIQRLLGVIVPASVILMGCIVATLIGSILLGLLSINDLAF